MSAAMKEFTIYTGVCIEDKGQALDQIRKNFLNAIKKSPLAESILCGEDKGLDCVVSNVKVYCGSK